MPPQTPSFAPDSSIPLPPLEPTPSAHAPEATFTETAKQIFARLNERKYLLLQRALLAVWPALVTLAVAYAFWGANVSNENGGEAIWASIQARPIEGWVVGALIVFSMVWGAVANAVLSIERVIWVDSYFDGKNLAPKESLRIARRLFPSAVRVWIWSWFRYWFPQLVFLVLAGAAIAGAAFAGVEPVILLVAGITTLIVLAFWSFFVGVKLRNLWFIFLDHHDGAHVETRVIADELDRLNATMKTKEFAKYVLSVAGVDTLAALTKMIAALAAQASGASKFLDRTVVGQGVKIYGQAVAAQAQAFARAIAAYVFYRAARAHLGSGQAVNERVYALAK